MTTHLPWCDPSRCSPPVHDGGAEAHRSAPIRFGSHSGYLYQIFAEVPYGAGRTVRRPMPQHFVGDACWSESGVSVADLRLLLDLIDGLNARTYSPPEVAKVAAALLSPDEETP